MTRQPDFDRVARIYRWAEYLSFGPLLQRTRTYYVGRLAGRRRALVLGDGDGRFLAQLFAQTDGMQALAVDTSAAMLRLLQRRSQAAMQRRGHHLSVWQGSAMDITPVEGTDLIVTHFFLDCLTQPQVDALAQRIGGHVGVGALWIVSDFGYPQAGIAKPLAALCVRSLYFVFRLLTGLRVTKLPDPQRALRAAGFVRLDRHQRLCGLLYTEMWQRQ